MNQNEVLVGQIEDYLRIQRRDKQLTETADLLNVVAELFQIVEVDLTPLQKEFVSVWKESKIGRNNDLLELMGLQYDKQQNKIIRFRNPKDYSYLINLNEEKLHRYADKLVLLLKKYEDQKQSEIEQLHKENNGKISLLENKKKEIQKLNYGPSERSDDYFVSMQQLLSNIDMSYAKNHIVIEQLEEMLLEQGVKVLWSFPEDKELNYFTIENVAHIRDELILRPSDLKNYYIIKPCLLEGDRVVLKGLAYLLSIESEHESSKGRYKVKSTFKSW